MFEKNPNYNPNDPSSNRYITKPTQAPGFSLSGVKNSITDMFSSQKNYFANPTATPAAPITPATNVQIPYKPGGAPAVGGMSIAPVKITSSAPTGFKGDPAVLAQQKALNAKGAGLVEDGIMGNLTRAAIAKYGGSAPGTTPGMLPTGGTPGAGAGTPAVPAFDLAAFATEAGKAGLSLDEYMKLQDTSTAMGAGEMDAIYNDLGIPGLIDSVFAKPAKTTEALYQDYYNQSGLADVKSRIAELDKTLSTIRDGRTTAIKEHQDNPWLSASTRSAKIAREKDLYGQREANSIQLRQQYLDQYDLGVGEVEKAVNRAAGDLEADRTLNTDKLNYLLNEAERKAGLKTVDTKKENLRYSKDYLSGRYKETLAAETRDFNRAVALKKADNPGVSTTGAIQLQLQNMGIDPNGNSIYAELAKSAGKKATTDTFRTSFEKGITTLYQLSDLDKAFSTYKTNTGQKFDTSPIMGIINSKNPYDTKAQAIKAQLTSIVPNLARGIYGEVGVLTDADIANYTKTLPNLKSTEDVRKALLAITTKSVQRSLENKLRVQANGGIDVSGFIPMLQEIEGVTNGLMANAGMPVGGGTQKQVSVIGLYGKADAATKKKIDQMILDGVPEASILAAFQ